jgi:hypothetical protein
MRLVIATLWLTACFYDDSPRLPADFATCTVADDGTAGVAAPTWYRDVEPIVVAKCQGCHVDGGLAPFALDHGAAIALRDDIQDAVTAMRMPPWQPAPCCNHYKDDRSLSDADRDTLLRWISAGQPDGDPADETVTTPPSLALPRVDLTATMHAAFSPEAVIGNNELRCFILDSDSLDTTKYVTGFDFHPGVRAEVHHVIAAAIPDADLASYLAKDGADGRPGWDCRGEGGELLTDKHYIGGWQPGGFAKVLPDGVGRELPAHSHIWVQIHYDGQGTPDLSSLDLMLADHVDRVEKGVPVGNPLWFVGDGLRIDPHTTDTVAFYAYDPTILSGGKPIDIANVMLHMHEFGTKGTLAVIHADGTADCILHITAWDFHWLTDYDLETPVHVVPGDQLYVECHWANPTDRTLRWGTDQEMCGGIFTYYEAK